MFMLHQSFGEHCFILLYTFISLNEMKFCLTYSVDLARQSILYIYISLEKKEIKSKILRHFLKILYSEQYLFLGEPCGRVLYKILQSNFLSGCMENSFRSPYQLEELCKVSLGTFLEKEHHLIFRRHERMSSVLEVEGRKCANALEIKFQHHIIKNNLNHFL